MTSQRSEILRATTEAATVLDRFPVGRRTSFDIVGAVMELGIPLLFRPLEGLWGATITVGDSVRGVLVTTKLGLAVQRFTLAHELGHVLLGHELSFDDTIGFAGRLGPDSEPVQEKAANTFASELLAPRALMLAASKAHRWTRNALLEPINVYQLSLRLGISFQATCWALAAKGVLSESNARAMQEGSVKNLKLAIASADMIENPWADVWALSAGDGGKFIEASSEDLFAVYLQDNASAGFLWELVDSSADAEMVGERTDLHDSYGAPTSRVQFLRLRSAGVHRLLFEHRRPWNRKSIARIDIGIDNHGKERGGLPRRDRERVLAGRVHA